jgi:DNA-binding response OmpR family regulator
MQTNRVLIVDDYPQSAESLAMLLKLRGYEVRVAHHGLEAVAAASEFRPHVALLDLGLPGLDGYEVCRRIRDTSWGQRMLMLAVTGWDRVEDRLRSAAAGFDSHVVKPIDFAVLDRLLAEPIVAAS